LKREHAKAGLKKADKFLAYLQGIETDDEIVIQKDRKSF